MKIVLIAYNFPYGGASANLLRYFSFCLSSEGNIVEVLLPTGSYYAVDSNTQRHGQIEDVKFKHLGFIHHPNNYIVKIIDNILGLLLPFFYLMVKSIKNELDIIIIYQPNIFSMISFLTSKFILRKKLIVILSEFYEKPKSSIFSVPSFHWYSFYFSIKYFVRYADKFIVLSNYLKNYLNTRLKSPKEILIMPNLTDSERFDINDVKPFKTNNITIGYVGIPVRKDGILDLIKSFSIVNKKNPNTHLLIIGDVPNGKSIVPELKKYALELGVNNENITFTGLQSHSNIPALLLSCQILALTRPNGVFAEAGFPTKLGEYFACKKPVVITKIGDIPYYFRNEEHVIFAEAENIESMVNAFELLINNRELANIISKNGYKWMNENLNYKNQAQRISNFIQIID